MAREKISYMIRKFGLLTIMCLMSLQQTYASKPKPEKEVAETKDKAAPSEAPTDKSQKKQRQDDINIGDLKIKIAATKKLIDNDKASLKEAEANYNKNKDFVDSPLKHKKLERKYKQDTKLLQRRIAIHEDMVKKWETILIEVTGKL